MFKWFRSKCLPHQNQVASESVHGRNLALKELSCSVCLEENKACKCEESFESCKKVDSDVSEDEQHHGEANNSVTHAVINMTGMLIGT